MKLKDIHAFFIQEGMKEELRKPAQIKKYLLEKRREYKKLRSIDKEFFDLESLHNPYGDSRILNGDLSRKIKRILVGIDIDVAEIVMADSLFQKGNQIDLILGHHPKGIALAGLCEVMALQTDVLINFGVAERIAKSFMNKRIDEVARSIHSSNHMRVVDAAKLLDMPLMCCHTPADNHVANYLQRLFNTRKPRTLGSVIDLLMKESEYSQAASLKAGPKILNGKQKDPAGRIFVDMTGGTEGAKEVFARLSQLGINTVVGMHYSQAHFNRLKDEHINIINAGHIASDNLGINLLLDKLAKKGQYDIIECSGFRRVRR